MGPLLLKEKETLEKEDKEKPKRRIKGITKEKGREKRGLQKDFE